MAQSERFYFWRGYYDALCKLPTDEQRGRFVLALCAYAFDGRTPDFGDDGVLDIAWSLVADAARESVRMGKRSSEAGQTGGRPPKESERGVKSPPKSPPLRGAKRGVKRGVESVEKGRVPKGTSLPTGERGSVRLSADAAAHAKDVASWYDANGIPEPPTPDNPEGAAG